jgi:pyruvate dehydrogenase complex dehydrogenase (E1) component
VVTRVCGVPTTTLGVNEFGQSAALADTHALHGIDAAPSWRRRCPMTATKGTISGSDGAGSSDDFPARRWSSPTATAVSATGRTFGGPT